MVENDVVVLGITLALIYVIAYRKNRFFGNMGFIGTSLTFFLLDSTSNVINAASLIILMTAIGSMVWDIMPTSMRTKVFG